MLLTFGQSLWGLTRLHPKLLFLRGWLRGAEEHLCLEAKP